MQIKTKLQKTRIAKYMFDFNFREIKKRNLDFSLTYSEIGTPETYTEVLNWSEIEKPKPGFITVQKIIILENGKSIKELTKEKCRKLILLLDLNNRKLPQTTK